MRHSSPGRVLQQMNLLRRQFAQSDELPFGDMLSSEMLREVLAEAQVTFIDRIYTPVTTLLVFLWQVIHQDQSCRAPRHEPLDDLRRGYTYHRDAQQPQVDHQGRPDKHGERKDVYRQDDQKGIARLMERDAPRSVPQPLKQLEQRHPEPGQGRTG